jgi:uncharacterized membrane-anchored protein YhcB (DUF1043 family)
VYSLDLVLLIAGAVAVLGIGIGILIGKRLSPQGQKNRELESQLDSALQEKKAYEDEVVEHFSSTATLLNRLTESYRDVHNHLAVGASTLCQDQGPVSLEKITGNAAGKDIPANLADVQQPLDYAPKSSPHETGMLNEEFGLERVQSPDDVIAEEPARH